MSEVAQEPAAQEEQTNGQPFSIELSLQRQEVPVVLKGSDGVVRNYVLKELMGPDRDKFITLSSGKMTFDKNGKPTGLRSFDGLQADLLHRGLFDDAGKNVPSGIIQGWPARVQIVLANKLMEMSGMLQGAEEQAKNY